MNYSNPRLEATFDNWPWGSHRTRCTFKVENHPTRGERVVRTTVNPKTGLDANPKTLAFSTRQRIVDGDDGRTYLLCDSSSYGFITVMQSNMQFTYESIGKTDPRFEATRALFDYEALKEVQDLGKKP